MKACYFFISNAKYFHEERGKILIIVFLNVFINLFMFLIENINLDNKCQNQYNYH